MADHRFTYEECVRVGQAAKVSETLALKTADRVRTQHTSAPDHELRNRQVQASIRGRDSDHDRHILFPYEVWLNGVRRTTLIGAYASLTDACEHAVQAGFRAAVWEYESDGRRVQVVRVSKDPATGRARAVALRD